MCSSCEALRGRVWGDFTIRQLAIVRRFYAQVAVAHGDGTATIVAHTPTGASLVFAIDRDGVPHEHHDRRLETCRRDLCSSCADAVVSCDPLDAFAARIRAERLAQHRTQEAVATAAGMSTSYLGRLERAEVDPGVRMVARVSAALAVPLTDLMDGVA
jgi:ferredoxin